MSVGSQIFIYCLDCKPLRRYFVAQIVLALVTGWSFRLVPVTPSFCFCEYLLAFWNYKMLQTLLAFSLPQHWNQPFLRGNFIPELRNQDLGAGSARCSRISLAPGPLSRQSEALQYVSERMRPHVRLHLSMVHILSYT